MVCLGYRLLLLLILEEEDEEEKGWRKLKNALLLLFSPALLLLLLLKKTKEIPRCKNYYCNMCFRLDHPNVVKLLEAYESKSYVYLVMEL